MTAEGAGGVSHAGSRFLADVTTLSAELAEALDGVRGLRSRHDPGRACWSISRSRSRWCRGHHRHRNPGRPAGAVRAGRLRQHLLATA